MISKLIIACLISLGRIRPAAADDREQKRQQNSRTPLTTTVS
jgi:hypothetical protein